MRTKPLIPRRRFSLLFLIGLLAALLACKKFRDAKKKVGEVQKAGETLQADKILTGSKSGNYYKAATELNTILDDKLVVTESEGSVDNLELLGNGKAKYAIVQLDTLTMFLRMGARQKKQANSALVVAPLTTELVHIIVNKKARIKSLKDLRGKKIGGGPEGSGSFVSCFTVMSYFNNVNMQKYANTANESYEASLKKVRAGDLDAMFITTRPGMPLLKNLEEDAKKTIELLDVGTGNVPRDLRYIYSVRSIEAKTYPWQPKAARALATPAYLFAASKYSSAKVKKVAKALYEKADELKSKSDLWENVSVERAQRDKKMGLGFHAGARTYFASLK